MRKLYGSRQKPLPKLLLLALKTATAHSAEKFENCQHPTQASLEEQSHTSTSFPFSERQELTCISVHISLNINRKEKYYEPKP
jgi:hypothetical protein